jgi:hypothetical protein
MLAGDGSQYESDTMYKNMWNTIGSVFINWYMNRVKGEIQWENDQPFIKVFDTFFHFSVTDIINLTRFDKTMFRGFIVIKYIFQIVIHSSDYSVQTPPFNIWIELRILMDSTCTPGNTGRQAFFFK